jgi:Fic family protein
MDGLIEHPGEFRRRQVGILKGNEIRRIAPGYAMVPGLIKDLFDYLKKDDAPDIIKSCVSHYEMEFIHPFKDGNGRIGRLWQTRLLMEANPIFEYIPIEETVRNSQERYYAVLAESDNAGKSTKFIEFMLEVIDESLRKTVESAKIPAIDFQKRADNALASLGDWFDRKAYMGVNKGISEATASRDLKRLLLEGRVEAAGTGRMTRYRRK